MKARITTIILLLSAVVFSGCSSAHFNYDGKVVSIQGLGTGNEFFFLEHGESS